MIHITFRRDSIESQLRHPMTIDLCSFSLRKGQECLCMITLTCASSLGCYLENLTTSHMIRLMTNLNTISSQLVSTKNYWKPNTQSELNQLTKPSYTVLNFSWSDPQEITCTNSLQKKTPASLISVFQIILWTA